MPELNIAKRVIATPKRKLNNSDDETNAFQIYIDGAAEKRSRSKSPFIARRGGYGNVELSPQKRHANKSQRLSPVAINEVTLLQELSKHDDTSNVVRFLGVSRGGKSITIKMELWGFDLSRFMHQYPARDPRTVLQILTGSFEGVGQLHAHGIVHRDIKDLNVLINLPATYNPGDVISSSWIKICDLGLAARITDEKALSRVFGTRAWYTPELIQLSGLKSDFCYLDFLEEKGLSGSIDQRTAFAMAHRHLNLFSSKDSDVYQLGLLGFKLMYHELPHMKKGILDENDRADGDIASLRTETLKFIIDDQDTPLDIQDLHDMFFQFLSDHMLVGDRAERFVDAIVLLQAFKATFSKFLK